MDRNRPDDPDAGVVDDKMAEARERIARIQKTAADPAETRDEAQEVEERAPEREQIERETIDAQEAARKR